jgi:hypothetical protein
LRILGSRFDRKEPPERFPQMFSGTGGTVLVRRSLTFRHFKFLFLNKASMYLFRTRSSKGFLTKKAPASVERRVYGSCRAAQMMQKPSAKKDREAARAHQRSRGRAAAHGRFSRDRRTVTIRSCSRIRGRAAREALTKNCQELLTLLK